MSDRSIESICIHGNYKPSEHNRARGIPLYQNAAFTYDSAEHAAALFNLDTPGSIYMRLGNPTVDEAENRLAALEEGIGAVAFASGMAALTGFILNLLRPGDEIAASDCLYGGSMGLFTETLPALGINTRFFNPLSAAGLRDILNHQTRLVFVENLANPSLTVPDLDGIAAVCRENRLPLAVDNTIASPVLCRPARFGADFIYHSCTKYLDGHGGIIGGMLIDTGRFEYDAARYPNLFTPAPGGASWIEKFGPEAFLKRLRGKILMNTGGCMAPFHAWLLLRGLETLPLRMERHVENAGKIVSFLIGHPAVKNVIYPGLPTHPAHATARRYLGGRFGAMVGFTLKGGYEECRHFVGRVQLLTHTTNIGDTKSLVIHPASTTHNNLTPEERARAGIPDDFIRLSVGLENAADLIEDIRQALA